MKPFLDADFLLAERRSGGSLPRLAPSAAHHRLPLSPVAVADGGEPPVPLASPRPGSTATTTSGARCGPTACRNGSARATRPTGRSSRRGRGRCRTRCAIRSITGRTWNCAVRSASHALLSPATARDGVRSRERTAAGAGVHDDGLCCTASASRSSARPTTRWTTSRRTGAGGAPEPVHARVSRRGGRTRRLRCTIRRRSMRGSPGSEPASGIEHRRPSASSSRR